MTRALACYLTHWPNWQKLLGAWHRPAHASHHVGWFCPICSKTRFQWA